MAGKLIIAGGNITHAENEIFTQFVRCGIETRHRAGHKDGTGSSNPSGLFVLVPSASENPERSFAYFKETLVRCGAEPDSIVCAEISVRKPGWERGAWSREQVKLAQDACGFWISGGDQNAVMDALQDEHGGDSPFLEVMRARNGGGVVIGGTSAGAAVMSNPMIGGGTSFGALVLPEAVKPAQTEISEALYVRQGLGFFTRGIVDQHFDVRARSARLLRALSLDPLRRTWGFGVAEDTAMVWDPETTAVSVIGSAGLYVFDARDARWQKMMNRYGVTDVVLHYLTRGDSLNLAQGVCKFTAKKQLEPGEEYYHVPEPVSSGVLSPYTDLASFIKHMLIDNAWDALFKDTSIVDAEWRHAKSYLIGFNDLSERLEWEIRCKRSQKQTKGYLDTSGVQSGIVSFENVRMDIIPC